VVANPAPGVLQGMPRLRLVQSLWAGVDRLLADASLPCDVPLARMVEPMLSAAMAETALWAALSLQRGFFEYAAQQRASVWLQHEQRRAEEVRVLVLGLGQMGCAVASRLAAQGFRVSGWRLGGPSTPSSIVAAHAGAEGLAAVLPAADIVFNLLPLTAATSGLLNARFFAGMRRGASLVNLARGAHVVDDDLLAALDGGRLRRAVLDVFQVEPLPAEHRYWQHPCVTLLPHVAALTDMRSAAQVVVANLRAVRDGTALVHVVDRARGY
jgi:glyoxylate/hydroxypyruvate reductase A